MKTTEIRLTGQTDYNERFPPRDAKKGYVACITGRAAGAVKYQREFLGSEVTLLEGDEGLYERQIGEKKGGYTRYYHVMLSHPEHGLILSVNCESEVPKIAKLLDDGVAIDDAVEVTNLRPSEKVEGRMIFDAVARTASQAKKAAVGQSVDSAVEACWQAMCNLPEKEQKKVLAALKLRVTPPKPTGKKVALIDFVNSCPADNLPVIFSAGVGCPGGQHLLAGDPDYQLPQSLESGELLGEVIEGCWSWDGHGEPRDANANSYTKIQSWYESRARALELTGVE